MEVTAYYVVSESLTDAAKYADTPVIDVAVTADGGSLRVELATTGVVAPTRPRALDCSA